MKNRLTMMVAVAAGLAAGCGPINDQLFLEVEQPELCKTMENQEFAGSEYQRRLEVNVAQQLPGLNFENPDGLVGTFRVPRVTFIARSGIENFDFVESGKITIETPPDNPDLVPVDVIDYARNGAATTGTLNLVGTSTVNLYDYLRGGTMSVLATLAGTLPSEPWSMDIQICLYARVRVNYLEAGNVFGGQ